MHALILAGGSGSRLWPLSSEELPKQFLKWGERGSLLEQTAKRCAPFNRVVITQSRYLPLIDESLFEAIIVEPAARSTAPAILLGIKYLLTLHGVGVEELCLVSPSDLHFDCDSAFHRSLLLAKKEALNGRIVTFGIPPSYPETGYGYMRAGGEGSVRFVEEFIEKPSYERATQFVESGDYYWNGGIFLFQIAPFLEEVRRSAPKLYSWFEQPYEEARVTFASLPSLSIDYAVMEHARERSLVVYPFGWSDLGSWKRLSEVLPKDGVGNHLSGNVEAVDTKDCLIFGEGVVTVGEKQR